MGGSSTCGYVEYTVVRFCVSELLVGSLRVFHARGSVSVSSQSMLSYVEDTHASRAATS